MFYTYLWLREDGTAYYVGKGKGRRAYKSDGHGVHRPKFGSRIFVQYWESEEKAFEIEKWWIAFWGRKDNATGILRNLTNGGEGISNISEETHKRMRDAQRGKILTEEHKAKIGKAGKGKKKSEEHRRKIKESNILTLKNNPRTEQWHVLQREAHLGQGKGKPWSDVRRKAQTEEVSRKISEARKRLRKCQI